MLTWFVVIAVLGPLLVVCVVPAFLGESHFAFLGYALAFRLTPVKRQIDYLRFLGASKDSAKELKLFGLNRFLTDRFTELSDDVYRDNVALAKRRLGATAFLSLITTLGYYSGYVYESVDAFNVELPNTTTGASGRATFTPSAVPVV